jgi:biopolymer transport protein ExbD
MPDNPESWNRVEPYAKGGKDTNGRDVKGLEEQGVKLYSTIEAMLPEVDGILLESVDGRPHLEQAKPVIAAGKPIYIDKPMAGSLADVLEIFRLAEEKKVPVFSASSLRFATGYQKMRNEQPLGKILGADTWGPSPLNAKHPDLFWYGIHGVEVLFTLMETGCQTVSRTQTNGTEFVVGVWNEGRIGTFRGLRTGKQDYGAFVFGEKGNGDAGGYDGYKPLVEEFCKFFQTGKPPFDPQETIEIFAFMEAADVSKANGGMPISIVDTMAKAKAEVSIPVALQVSPNGALRMNDANIELSKLAETLDGLTRDKPNSRVKVILRAEKGTPHEIVLGVCNNLGKSMLANFLYER